MPKEDTQFKKGQSGNPKGRPKGSISYTDALKRVLAAEKMSVELTVNGKKKHIDVVSNGKNFYDGIAVVQIMEALKGNMQAIKDISDRVEGKPMQKVETKDVSQKPREIIVSDQATLNALEGVVNSINE